MKAAPFTRLALSALLGLGAARAGPYSAGSNDPTKNDAPIPGFIGPHGDGAAHLQTGPTTFINPGNYVNPLFFGWALDWSDYLRSDGESLYSDVAFALGPVSGKNFDVLSLGDLSSAQLTDGLFPGGLTLYFPDPIRDLTGADFAVFENAFNVGPGSIFADLAHVEVSADGFTFIRFPATSLTPATTGEYGTIDPTNVRNLAGKHFNAYGASWGTPFDLAETGLPAIYFIRLVDIPGSGTFRDSANRPIYDAWLTTGSGGFDLEALGVISLATTFATWPSLHNLAGDDLLATADPDADGLPNLLEYAFSRLPDRPDISPAVTVEKNANRLEIIFTRDERATDLIYEIQARASLNAGQWITIAQSTGGAPVTGTGGFTPTITETSASPIACVGVIRKVRVADGQTLTSHLSRFLRVKVSRPTP